MAVVLKTYGAQLQEVQEAITAVSTSQRYEINGRMMQKADLEWLHKREMYLAEQYRMYGDVIVGSNVSRGACAVSFGNS